MKIAFI